MAQKHLGVVIDEDEQVFSVFGELGPDNEIIHVFICIGGSQVGDFPYGKSGGGSLTRLDQDIQAAAQVVAKRSVDDPQLADKDNIVTLPLLIEEV